MRSRHYYGIYPIIILFTLLGAKLVGAGQDVASELAELEKKISDPNTPLEDMIEATSKAGLLYYEERLYDDDDALKMYDNLLKMYDKLLKDPGFEIKLKDSNKSYQNAYYRRALTYYALKDYESAISDLNQVLQYHPDNEFRAKVFRLLGLAYRALKNYESAISNLNQALQYQMAVDDREKVYHDLAKTYYFQGKAWMEDDNDDNDNEALKAFDEVIKLAPKLGEQAKDIIYEAYSKQAEIYLRQGRVEDAIKIIDRASYHTSYRQIAEDWYRTIKKLLENHGGELIDLAEKVVNPRWPSPLLANVYKIMGDIYKQRNDIDKAIYYYQLAIQCLEEGIKYSTAYPKELTPPENKSILHFSIGRLLFERGGDEALKAAEREFEAALKIPGISNHPDAYWIGDALLYLARIDQQCERYRKARQKIDTAIEKYKLVEKQSKIPEYREYVKRQRIVAEIRIADTLYQKAALTEEKESSLWHYVLWHYGRANKLACQQDDSELKAIALYGKFQCWRKLGEQSKMLTIAREIVQADYSSSGLTIGNILIEIGDTLLEKEQHADALQAFEKAISLSIPLEGEVHAFFQAGICCQSLAKQFPSQRQEYLEKSIGYYSAILRDRFVTKPEFEADVVKAKHNKAFALHRLGNNRAAIPLLKSIEDAETLSPEERKSVLNLLGRIYADEQQYAEAIRVYKKLLSLSETEQAKSDIYGTLAGLHRNQKNYEVAISHYQSVIQMDIVPEKVCEAFYAIADCYYLGKNAPAAIKAYREALKRYPHSNYAPKAQYNLVISLDKIDNRVAMRTEARGFIRLYENEDNPQIHQLVVDVQAVLTQSLLEKFHDKSASQSDIDEIKKYLTERINNPNTKKSNKAQAYYERGGILAEEKRFLQAIDDLQQAINLYEAVGDESLISEIWSKLGDLYIKVGQKENASKAFWQVIQVSNNPSLIENATNQLYQLKDLNGALLGAKRHKELIGSDDVDSQIKIHDLIGSLYYEKAKSNPASSPKRMENYRHATESFKRVVELADNQTLQDKTQELVSKSTSNLAFIYYLLAGHEDSLKKRESFYKEAARIFLYLADNHHGDTDIVASWLYYAGLSDIKVNNRNRVVHTFKRIVDRFPTSEYVDDALYQMGEMSIEGEKYEQALRYFLRLWEEYPKSKRAVDAAIYVANFYLQSAQNEELSEDKQRSYANKARGCFKKIQKDYPKTYVGELNVGIGDASYLLGEYQTAKQSYQKVIDRYANKKTTISERTLQLIKRANEGLKRIRVVFTAKQIDDGKINKDELDARIGDASWLIGDLQEAKRSYQRLIGRYAKQETVPQKIREFIKRAGDRLKQIRDDLLKKGVREDTLNKLDVRIGDAYWLIGDLQEAKQSYQRLIDRYGYWGKLPKNMQHLIDSDTREFLNRAKKRIDKINTKKNRD